MLLRDLSGKRHVWTIVIAGGAIASIVEYGRESALSGRLLGGNSRIGLAFGVAGGVICLFLLALWPRKAYRGWAQRLRLGTTQSWMRAHIWLGLLAIPLLVMHGGVWPWGGTLSTVLMALFLTVSASGLYGLWLQQVIPRRLLLEVPAETVHTEIDVVCAQLRAEAERLVYGACQNVVAAGGLAPPRMIKVEGKPDARPLPAVPPVPGAEPVLRDMLSAVGPFLCADDVYRQRGGIPWDGATARSGHSLGGRLSEAKAAALFFADYRVRLDPRAHPLVDGLAKLCERRLQYDRQSRLQSRLHSWLAVHLPLSVAMTVLMMIHAIAALGYL
jgi:hypothetical protein